MSRYFCLTSTLELSNFQIVSHSPFQGCVTQGTEKILWYSRITRAGLLPLPQYQGYMASRLANITALLYSITPYN